MVVSGNGFHARSSCCNAETVEMKPCKLFLPFCFWLYLPMIGCLPLNSILPRRDTFQKLFRTAYGERSTASLLHERTNWRTNQRGRLQNNLLDLGDRVRSNASTVLVL